MAGFAAKYQGHLMIMKSTICQKFRFLINVNQVVGVQKSKSSTNSLKDFVAVADAKWEQT